MIEVILIGIDSGLHPPRGSDDSYDRRACKGSGDTFSRENDTFEVVDRAADFAK